MVVSGAGLSLTGAWTHDGAAIPLPLEYGAAMPEKIDLEYVSSGEGAIDGVLSISFLDNWDAELTFAAPILVR